MYDFQASEVRTADPQTIAGTNQPESPAAWAVSAAVALKAGYGKGKPLHLQAPPRDAWRGRLEAGVLAGMMDVAAFGTGSEIDEAYAGRGDFTLDLERGRTMDRRARSTHRGTDLEAVEI